MARCSAHTDKGVCARPFTQLSGDSTGCPVHGIRAAWSPSKHELAKLVLEWAREGRDHGGVNPYSLTMVKAACVIMGEDL